MTNILVTAIGSFSASSVIKSLRKNVDVKVYGCDIYPAEWHNISLLFDKVFKAPLVSNEAEYKAFIDNICLDYEVDFIIPLTDIEVDFFNKFREYYQQKNITATISNSKSLSIARDKYALSKYTNAIDELTQIPTYKFNELESHIDFPLIAKVVNGRSSEGVFFVNSKEDLKRDIDFNKYIFQKVIKGKICTVDYVRSSQTKNDFCLPRWEHLRTKNGAGLTVETFYSEKINRIVSTIGNDLDINGCVNIEFIVNEDSYHLIDINPRFSAGIAFSYAVGYDFVENHIQCFLNKDIKKGVEYKKAIVQKVMSEVINKTHE